MSPSAGGGLLIATLFTTDIDFLFLYSEPLRGERQIFYLSKKSGLKDTNMLLDCSPARKLDTRPPSGQTLVSRSLPD